MKRSVNINRATIAMAANELGKAQSFESMTVDDICQQAQISRSTFYRTFNDKYAILLWIESIPFEHGITQMGRTLTCLEGATVVLEGFGLFNDLLYSARNSTERQEDETKWIDKARDTFIETATVFHHERRDREIEFQSHRAATCLLQTTKAMATGLHEDTPAQAALLIANAFPPRLRALLDNPTERAPAAHINIGSIMLSELQR